MENIIVCCKYQTPKALFKAQVIAAGLEEELEEEMWFKSLMKMKQNNHKNRGAVADTLKLSQTLQCKIFVLEWGKTN
ncbi:unnamed protein product [Clavelina lepadiformis]|uniref:Uncharacterized protein n=1 Tax=Clavelina lepadiformis TaxID=159417 RepID=A0ABP0FXC1_CLALP